MPAALSVARFFPVCVVRLLDFFADVLDVFFATIFDRPSLLFRRRWTSLLACPLDSIILPSARNSKSRLKTACR
ncbi:MAG TPA: hypothetical protein VNI36_10425, partial [Candidatus Dormibacteraeota bacterium]|nr:hypothetical protein [Candidatus Dormibacteraeota bacterium]